MEPTTTEATTIPTTMSALSGTTASTTPQESETSTSTTTPTTSPESETTTTTTITATTIPELGSTATATALTTTPQESETTSTTTASTTPPESETTAAAATTTTSTTVAAAATTTTSTTVAAATTTSTTTTTTTTTTAATTTTTCEKGTCQCDWDMYEVEGHCVAYALSKSHVVKATSQSTTSITVTWPEVTFPEVQSVIYNVTWSVSPESDKNGRSTKVRTMTIDSLVPGTMYHLEVTALVTPPRAEGRVLQLAFPPVSQYTVPATLGATIQQDFVNGLILIFEPPAGGYDYCQVKINEMDVNLKETVKTFPSQKFNCTYLVFSQASIGLKYKMDVVVVSGHMTGQTSSVSAVVPEGVPSKVQNLTLENVASDSVRLTWMPPRYMQGYFKYYELQLFQNELCLSHMILYTPSSDKTGRTRGPETGQLSKHSRRDTDMCGMEGNKLIESSETNGQLMVYLGDLSPASPYTVHVWAVNNLYQGITSTLTFSTTSAVPSLPGSPRAEVKSWSEVRVTWESPPYPGPTTYVIQVFDSAPKEGIDPKQTVEVKGYNQTSTIISGLNYFSTYYFLIKATTSVGSSPPVQFGPVTTLEKVSDPVQNFRVTGTTSYSISLAWAPPVNVYGRLRAYVIFVLRQNVQGTCEQIIIMSEGQTQLQVNQTLCSYEGQYLTRDIKSGTVTCNITDLDPYLTYDVYVAPYNGAGVGQVKTLFAVTNISAPSVPSGLSCSTPGRGTIVLTWRPPDKRTGPTTYTVKVAQAKHVTGTDLGSEPYISIDVNGYSNTSAQLNGLRDYWFYTFSITAHTEAGASQPVTLDACRTLSAAPGEVTEISVVVSPDQPHTAVVTWQCPKEVDRRGEMEIFQLLQSAKTLLRKDLDPVWLNDSVYTVKVARDPCSGQAYSQSVPVFPQVVYLFQIRAKVKGVTELGNATSQTFTLPGIAPPPIMSTPTQAISDKGDLIKETSFTVTLCATCFLDNVNGEVVTFGVLVCLDEFCNKGQPQHELSLPGLTSRVPTWKAARDSHFKVEFRATDKNWETRVRTAAKDKQNNIMFEVGNDTSCAEELPTSYCNGPLPSETSFRLRLFSCTSEGCSVSNYSSAFQTAVSTSSGSSDGLVIGGAVAGVVIAVVVIIAVVVARLWRRASKFQCCRSDTELSHVIALKELGDHKRNKKSRSIQIQDFARTLSNLHEDGNRLFHLEYQELDQLTPYHPMDVGMDVSHRPDNRWTNIVPYDHSRVKLTVVQGDITCSHDYINANYIAGVDSTRDYIATQGPLTRTVPDFWRMVWEQRTSVIVMLSDFLEKDKRSGMMKEKVARYFPDEADSSTEQYGHLVVTRTGKVDRKDWEIRTFKLTHEKERRSRFVKHFFYKGWSDHEADIDPSDLIDFAHIVRAETRAHPHAPLVVHCSAGVGRTGTYIGVDYFLQYIKGLGSEIGQGDRRSGVRKTNQRSGVRGAEHTVDIFAFVLAMRDRRRFMVQTEGQYIFLYEAVQKMLLRTFQQGQKEEAGEEEDYATVYCPPPYSALHGASSGQEDAVYDDVEQLQVTSSRKT